MNKELIEYLKTYQLWRRGADIEQPDPTELGEKLDEAIRVCQEAGFDVEVLKYWEGISECNCDSPHPIGGCLKCDMQNLIMSESRKKHPLTTKEEAVKQVAEFDKVQPINKGSSARIIHKGVENPADCRLNSCPFCGVIEKPIKPILMNGDNKPTNIEGTANPPYYVQCSYCLGTGPPAVDGVNAVEYWNERDSEENYKTMKEETWAEEHKDIWEAKAWREMRDVDAIVEERDALISENARLHNIIIELHRIIDLDEADKR